MYFVANAHDPVVPKAVFEEVQGEMLRRSQRYREPGARREGGPETLNRRLLCAYCGRVLRKCILPDGEAQWECRLRPCTKKRENFEGERKCRLRHLPEREAKKGILEAFSRLPEYLESWILPRRAAAEAARRSFDEEAAPGEGSPVDAPAVSETVRLWTEDPKTADKTKTLERAELTRTLLDLRALQELAEEIAGRQKNAELRAVLSCPAIRQCKDGPLGNEAKAFAASDPEPGFSRRPAPEKEASAERVNGEDPPAACFDYEDFYQRTRLHLPDEMFGKNGQLCQFDDALIIRYLDKVIVSDETLAVTFKAGLVIMVNNIKKII